MKFLKSNSLQVLFICVYVVSTQIFALEQNTKEWVAVNYQQLFGQDKKWLAYLYSQIRFKNDNPAVQIILVESGLQYQVLSGKSLGVGYRWTGDNPYNGFDQANRIFQQMIIRKKWQNTFVFRARLEETQYAGESHIAWRLRQRLAITLEKKFLNKIVPHFYEEVFFQITHNSRTSKGFFGENRLFLGFNLLQSEKSWWEIGYINQLQMRRPGESENKMSHIASVTYNFS